jgi:hypothetical protein
MKTAPSHLTVNIFPPTAGNTAKGSGKTFQRCLFTGAFDFFIPIAANPVYNNVNRGLPMYDCHFNCRLNLDHALKLFGSCPAKFREIHDGFGKNQRLTLIRRLK